MNRGTTSDPQRHSRENGRAAVTALESRLTELEKLATSQDRELRIQFERIAQLQAEWDVLRIRFSTSLGQSAAPSIPPSTRSGVRGPADSPRTANCAVIVSANRRSGHVRAE